MSKFYVSCGDLKAIVDSKTKRAAIIKAFLKSFLKNDQIKLSSCFVKVSEIGFGISHNDSLFSIEKVLADLETEIDLTIQEEICGKTDLDLDLDLDEKK